MRKLMLKIALAANVAIAGATAHAAIIVHEEQMARLEEQQIIQAPIAGIKNHFWFDYRSNIGEAQKELASDLRGVSDSEDLRDAKDEYRSELSGERRHYIKEMREWGYRYGTVTVED